MAEGQRSMLLSMRPRHADAIMAGRKTVEVRRRRIVAPPDTRIIIYATTPRQAVVATARLVWTRIARAEQAWQEFSGEMGIDREELDAYLGGREACLLALAGVEILSQPITLERLREAGSFRPPQSFRYVNGGDGPLLSALAQAGANGQTTS